LGRRQSLSYSIISQRLMEPRRSLPFSQEPSTSLYRERDQSSPKHTILFLEHLSTYGSTALVNLGHFFSFLIYTHSVGLLGQGISPPQGRYLHTEQHKHRIDAHNTDIHALSGIQNHDPRLRRGEDGSCLRTRGHCDRHFSNIHFNIIFPPKDRSF
jgi:hypothetical protein